MKADEYFAALIGWGIGDGLGILLGLDLRDQFVLLIVGLVFFTFAYFVTN